jgi:hypothetical protein
MVSGEVVPRRSTRVQFLLEKSYLGTSPGEIILINIRERVLENLYPPNLAYDALSYLVIKYWVLLRKNLSYVVVEKSFVIFSYRILGITSEKKNTSFSVIKLCVRFFLKSTFSVLGLICHAIWILACIILYMLYMCLHFKSFWIIWNDSHSLMCGNDVSSNFDTSDTTISLAGVLTDIKVKWQ